VIIVSFEAAGGDVGEWIHGDGACKALGGGEWLGMVWVGGGRYRT
jgi:hypothetical protein